MSDWVQGRVVENLRWSDQLYMMRVDAPVDPFHAGQFTRLALDIDGERVARAYSYVNSPKDEHLEFYFNTVPDGPLSNRLSSLQAGDDLWVAPRPVGLLTLEQIDDADHLWLLATGTAIGPFISILRSDLPWQRFSRIILVHGVRTAEELAYQDAIQGFRERDPEKFTMVPFVSREKVDYALEGRIPDAIANGELENRVGIDFSAAQSQVMICGNKGMVQDTQRQLELLGLKKHRRSEPGQITTENYW
jgi:ferredoxin--NADP+ reductase